MGIVASQLTGVVSISGAAQGKADLLSVGAASQTAQADLTQLQNATKDVSTILSSRLSAELKNAQSGLQDLAQRAEAAGLDVSKFASLQMQASEASARLGVAQAQAAAAMEKANIVAADASSSTEQVALAQSKAALSAELVQKAEASAGNAMSMVKGEATRLADALSADAEKTGFFSSLLGGLREKAAMATEGLFSGFKNAAGGILEFGSKLGQTAFGLQFLWQSVTGLGQALVGSNASMEQTTVAFGTLLHSGDAASKMVKDLWKFAAETPFEFPDITNSAKRMLAFGFSAQSVLPMLHSVGDAVSALGGGAFEIDRVTTALGQMQAKGKVNAQDMMQLAEVGIPAWQLLSDGMGITTAQAQKMSEEGLLPAGKAINILLDGMGKAFGGGMQAQSQTFNGLLSTFKDNTMAAWRAFTGPLFEQSKASLIKLGELVTSPAFQRFATDMGVKVGGALSAVSQFISNTVVPAFENIVHAFQVAGSWLSDFVGRGQAGIPILAGVGAVIAGALTIAFVGLVAAISPVALIVAGVGIAIAGLTAVFLHFYNTSAGFRDFISGVGIVLQQIGSFIVSTFTPVWQQLQDVWKSQLQPALQELWASFKQIQPELTIVAEIIGGVLLASLGLLIFELGGIIGGIAGMAHGIAEIFGGIIQVVTGYIQIIAGIVAFIVDLFTGHFDRLGGDLKVILGGIGEIFSGFGNVLKGIVDGIVGGLTGSFKGAATSVIGYLNDIVYGVQDKTKSAATAAQIHTAEMKDKSVENAQKMNEQVQTNLITMRNGIEDQLKQTTDVAQRHTLEMKLKTVNNSLEMAQATGRNLVDMRYKSQEQLDLLKQGVDTSLMSAADKAKYHALNMKNFYLDGVIAMDDQSIQKVDEMRLGILDELSRTTDGAKKQALTMQLDQVTHAENAAKRVKDVHVKARTDNESEMDKLKASSKQKHGDILQNIKNIWGGIGNWFHGRWVDVQNIFGGIGAWFHDKWSEAWGATTSVFGHIGQWFEDRWHDTQAIFGSIGAWFHDRWQEAWNGVTAFFGTIGHWFSDRWAEVMNSTKPFMDYMGDVFQTMWNILVAIWGKVSIWFHDRFTEAYNKVVEVFGPIGKWFQDRWKDVQNIFGSVGQWFHDRWIEAWNGTTWLFATLGKWFGDRWHDVQNIFGGIGQWFHDRWIEAWNKVVAIWTPIGKWFGDRWHDVQNILGGVGNWFHDRFQEAWNKVVGVWTPIGKWFGDRWHDIANGVEWLKNAVVARFNDIKTGAINIIHDMVNGIVDKLNDGISGIENFINFFGLGLDNIAKSLGTTGTIPVAHLGRIHHYAEGTDEHQGGFAVVGEKGPELAWMPKGSKVASHDITELFLSMTGGKIPGYAGGIGDLGSQILGWLSGGAKTILDNVISSLHITAPNLPGMSNISSGIFDTLKNWALSWVTSILPKFDFGGQSVNIPGNVQSWIEAAMTLTGTPGSWAGPLGTIAMHESGGNPNSINLTDINAQQGHPSQGLFQMIPSTFAAHMLPGHTNILNPVDSAASAIGYIRGRYGDVFHVPGILSMARGGSYIGYAGGGVVDEPIAGLGLRTGTRYSFGERGKELVMPYIPAGVQLSPPQASSAAPSAVSRGGNQTIILELDKQAFGRIVMPIVVDKIRNRVNTTF